MKKAILTAAGSLLLGLMVVQAQTDPDSVKTPTQQSVPPTDQYRNTDPQINRQRTTDTRTRSSGNNSDSIETQRTGVQGTTSGSQPYDTAMHSERSNQYDSDITDKTNDNKKGVSGMSSTEPTGNPEVTTPTPTTTSGTTGTGPTGNSTSGNDGTIGAPNSRTTNANDSSRLDAPNEPAPGKSDKKN